MPHCHHRYLASWLQVLKGDKNEIFRAASAAQKICDYVSKLAVEAQPVREVVDGSNADALILVADRSRHGEVVHQRTPFQGPKQEPKRRLIKLSDDILAPGAVGALGTPFPD